MADGAFSSRLRASSVEVLLGKEAVKEGRSVRKNAFVFRPFIFNGRLIFILLMSVELAFECCKSTIALEDEVVEDEDLPDPSSLKLPSRRAFRPASMMAGSASMMLGLRVLHEDIKGIVGISLHASA